MTSSPPAGLLARAADRTWDVAVIGAGPAGALSALLCARLGASTLLLEQRPVPRQKVCGGCLNRAALSALAAAGLGELPQRHGAVPLRLLELRGAGRSSRVHAPGAALSRPRLDAALVLEAVGAGAMVLTGVRAALRLAPDLHTLRLDHAGGRLEARARVVIAASGLGHRFLEDERAAASTVAPASRIGAGMRLSRHPDVVAGVVCMCWAESGYVGLVQVEDGSVNVAAALDPRVVRRLGGPGAAAAAIASSAGLRDPGLLTQGDWRGTPPLTWRRASVALERVFVLGDAAGYVEPFTGEGMAWALGSAHRVAPLAIRALAENARRVADEWTHDHAASVGRRQRLCRAVAATLRRPVWTRAVLKLLEQAPGLAGPFVKAVNATLSAAPGG